MREEGVPAPAVAAGCSPLSAGLAGHKSGRPAAAARQGDRGEGRLRSPVTSRQNNSRAVRGGRKLRQLITCISPCVRSDGSAAASDRRRAAKAHPSLKGQTEPGAIRSSLRETMPWPAADGDKYLHRPWMGLEAYIWTGFQSDLLLRA